MDEILTEFKQESNGLINELIEILEGVEGDISQRGRLEEYGQKVDRIMGTAKSLATADIAKDIMEKIGNYGELCKIVGYKCSQIDKNAGLFDLVIAFLLDATEMLQKMVEDVDQGKLDFKSLLGQTFLDRLKWIDRQLGEGLRGTVATPAGGAAKKAVADINQKQIADVLAQLGLT